MKRILIIQDDKYIVGLVRYNPGKEGFQVRSVEDGIAGLKQVKESPPDLLLLDQMFPKLEGAGDPHGDPP